MADALVNINGNNMQTLEVLILLTTMALLPSIVIMMTSFSRIVIVLSILRTALGLQNTPPNMVLIGLALFLSLFIMTPTIDRINEEAYQPYEQGMLTQKEALDKAAVPMKEFMLAQTKVDTLNMYLDFAGEDTPEEESDLPLTVIIPAFMTSELSRAFIMGFLIFIPFLIIDIVVSSTLMSMGMIMLPPAMISLPFKILLFIVIDGWGMLFSTLVNSFN